MGVVTERKIKPQHAPYDSVSAVPYSARVPDGEYLALCIRVYHNRHSRNYGERVYLDFQLWDCEAEGEIIRMFLWPSRYPTSNFYRSWAIARGGPPRSHNTKMSPRVFIGKLFRVLTSTVKPKHRIVAEDGKTRPGPFLPESFWYSKVACILTLEATNEKVLQMPTLNTTQEGGAAPLRPPVTLTNFSPNPHSKSGLSEGMVGRRELGVGNQRGNAEGFAARDGNQHNAPPLAGEERKTSSPAPSPQKRLSRASLSLEQQKQILRERGLLP